MKSLKVSEIINAYNVLGSAKYQKLDDGDKIKVWKIARLLKPVAQQFEEDRQDASKSLSSDYLTENLPKAQQYEKAVQEGQESLPMTEQEYQEFLKEFIRYRSLVQKALEELLSKQVELDFEPLTEDALGKLLASNDWTLRQAEALECIM